MPDPLAIDLYCGLGGWSEGFLAEGYQCRGYDIEAHDYGSGGYSGELILRDVRSMHGSECKDAAVIVASPPCQEPSYRAMPWSRAKALNAIGPPHLFIELFNACFRIQREASEAAGRRIPLVVENVRGAQPWVGRAPANYGSFYLWGDVGMVGRKVVCVIEGRIVGGVGVTPQKASKVPGFRFDGSGKSFQTASVEGLKAAGQNWNEWKDWDGTEENRPASVRPWGDAVKVPGIKLSEVGFNVAAAQRYRAQRDGVKFSQSGDAWFDGKPRDKMLGDKGPAAFGSRSNSRKAASAQIAKIPFPLAQHIARTFKPILHDLVPDLEG